MVIIDIIGILGCILAAVYTIISFPITVKTANGEIYPRKMRSFQFGIGILMYSCLAIYAIQKHIYILALVNVLSGMKYAIVLIQPLINDKYKKGNIDL